MKNKVCKDCDNRFLGCHDYCARYKAEKPEMESLKELKIKEYDSRDFHKTRINAFYKK